jgi:hypothetical protein
MAERREGGVLKNFFSKFRSNSSRESDHRDELYYEKLLHPDNQSKRDFGVYSIRLVVMREEKLVYDSDTFQPNPTQGFPQDLCDSGHNSLSSSEKSSLCKSSTVSSSLVEKTNGRLTCSGANSSSSLPSSCRGSSHRNGMNSEIAVYTELMFGAVGGKRKEHQTKIHFIKYVCTYVCQWVLKEKVSVCLCTYLCYWSPLPIHSLLCCLFQYLLKCELNPTTYVCINAYTCT